MTRALLLVALTACSIKPIDYTGKQCPCPEDYDCNLATNTCTKQLVGDARVDSRSTIDSALPGTSCLANPKPNLVYSSVGFADFPQGWLGANGQWSKEGGEVKQTNATNALAWISHSVGNTTPNYRVAATMRVIDGLDDAGIGIAVRVTNMQGNMYTCTIAPKNGQLELKYWQQSTEIVLAVQDVAIMDSQATLTMEMNIDGMNMTCCLRDYSTASIAASNGIWTTGNPGVVTTQAEAAFGSFFAYQ